MADLPDMAYTLWDWASGSELCPPDPANPDPQDCHNYETHIGWLNSNHMLPQSRRWYEHLHALALARAAACKQAHDAIPAEHRPRFERWLRACEQTALLIEGVGHHYLQDSWSSGHMWERWGGTEVADFGGNRTLGFAVGAFVGTIHGAGAMLGEGFDDPICAPHPDGIYMDPTPEIPGVGTIVGQSLPRPGVGDVYLNDFLLTNADYAPQQRALFGCAVSGLRAVYGATAQVHGGMQSVSGDFDANRSVLDDSCWGQRATNRALAVGCGLHQGTFPNQQRLLGVVTPEDVADVLSLALSGGILDLAQMFVPALAPLEGLGPVVEEQFRLSAAQACTLAAARALEEPDGTDVASGGFPPLAGIQPNGFYARGGAAAPQELPAAYADPFLPWNLDEPDPVLRQRKTALHLTFADAHVAERCAVLTEVQLLGYQVAAMVVQDLGDDALIEARCAQCAAMVAPHLRFGVAGSHDTRREAFCALAGGASAFVYTGDDPQDFTGSEPTDLPSLLAAARKFCRCEEEDDDCGYPPNELPPGSYALSCDSCSINGTTLGCSCRRIDQSTQSTQIDVGSCRVDRDIANIDGVLACVDCS
jgi:hypothetical protein